MPNASKPPTNGSNGGASSPSSTRRRARRLATVAIHAPLAWTLPARTQYVTVARENRRELRSPDGIHASSLAPRGAHEGVRSHPVTMARDTGEGSEFSVTGAHARPDQSARRVAFVAAVLACLGWSSLYTAAKLAMREVTGLMVAFDRTTVACLVLTLIVVVRAGGVRPGVAHLMATARSARWGAVELGLVNFAGTSVLAMTAQQYLPASVNGLVNNLAPLWLSIWAATTGGASRPLLLVAGSAIAAVGVGAVLLGDAIFGTGAAVLPDPTPSTWMGVAISLSGSLLIGYQNAVARRVMPGHDAIAITALGAATGSLATGTVLSLGIGGSLPAFLSVDSGTLLALAWLGTVTTAFNFTLWGYALSILPVARIANLQYMVPPLGVVVGVVVLGEPVGPGLVVGAVAILGGIILAQRGAVRD